MGDDVSSKKGISKPRVSIDDGLYGDNSESDNHGVTSYPPEEDIMTDSSEADSGSTDNNTEGADSSRKGMEKTVP